MTTQFAERRHITKKMDWQISRQDPEFFWSQVQQLRLESPGLFFDTTVHCNDGSFSWNRLCLGLSLSSCQPLLTIDLSFEVDIVVYLPDLTVQQLKEVLEANLPEESTFSLHPGLTSSSVSYTLVPQVAHRLSQISQVPQNNRYSPQKNQVTTINRATLPLKPGTEGLMKSLKDPETGRTYWKCTQCSYFNKSAKSSKYKVERHVTSKHLGKTRVDGVKMEVVEQDEEEMVYEGFDDDFLAAELLEQAGGYEGETDIKPDVDDLDEKMNKGDWGDSTGDWGNVAEETRTEDGTPISNDMADYAKVECQLCGTQDPITTFRKEHLVRAHNMSIVDYKSQFGRKLKVVEKVLHRCQICHDLVTHDSDSIGLHLKKPGHNISHKNYNLAYLVDTRSQKRKSRQFYQSVYQPFEKKEIRAEPERQTSCDGEDVGSNNGEDVQQPFPDENPTSHESWNMTDANLSKEPTDTDVRNMIQKMNESYDTVEGKRKRTSTKGALVRTIEEGTLVREMQNKRHSEQVSITIDTPGILESIQVGPPFVCVIPSCDGKSYPAVGSLKRHYFNHDPDMYSMWVCPEPDCNFLQPEDHMGKMVKHIMEEHNKRREWARENAILETSKKLKEFKVFTNFNSARKHTYKQRKMKIDKIRISLDDPLVLSSFATGGVDGVWTCHLVDCGFSCTSAYELKTHFKGHANNLNNDDFECNLCASTSKTVQKMENHMQQEHPDTLFLAENGNPQYRKVEANGWESFLEAVKDILATNPHYVDGRGRHKKYEGVVNVQAVNEQCVICKEPFNTREAFEDHSKVHQPDLIKFRCDQCEDGFVVESVFENHIRSHSVLYDTLDQGFYRCNGCSLRFDNIREAKKHLSAKHINLLQNVDFCEYCSDFFTSKALLKQHMFRHVDCFKCPNCPKRRFLTNEELEEHISTSKCSVKEQIVCPHCGKVCSHMVNLKKHIRDSHGKGFKIRCKICQSFFSSMKLMKQHLQKAHKIRQDYYNFYSKEEDGSEEGLTRGEKCSVSKKFKKDPPNHGFDYPTPSAGYMFPFST